MWFAGMPTCGTHPPSPTQLCRLCSEVTEGLSPECPTVWDEALNGTRPETTCRKRLGIVKEAQCDIKNQVGITWAHRAAVLGGGRMRGMDCLAHRLGGPVHCGTKNQVRHRGKGWLYKVPWWYRQVSGTTKRRSWCGSLQGATFAGSIAIFAILQRVTFAGLIAVCGCLHACSSNRKTRGLSCPLHYPTVHSHCLPPLSRAGAGRAWSATAASKGPSSCPTPPPQS